MSTKPGQLQFGDKPGGLVVDYLGLAHELKQALAVYTESGGTGETAVDQEQAVAALREKYEVCRGLFHGFDRGAWAAGAPAERLGLLPAAQEHDVRGNVTIDWTLRENVRVNLRRLVRCVLRRHGYPPDRQEAATRTVLEQAEALSASWAAGDRAGSD